MKNKFNGIVLKVIAILVLLIGSALVLTSSNPRMIAGSPAPTTVSEKDLSESKAQNEEVTYEGKDGIDALTLLKNIAEVEQDSTGLVTTIDKRAVDGKKREFWGFYVNGEMSEVGPADYQTNDEDEIVWKIETY